MNFSNMEASLAEATKRFNEIVSRRERLIKESRDVIALSAKAGKILLIQVKSGSSRMKKLELETFKIWADQFNASAEIWYYKKRGKLQRHSVRKQLMEQPLAISVRQSPL